MLNSDGKALVGGISGTSAIEAAADSRWFHLLKKVVISTLVADIAAIFGIRNNLTRPCLHSVVSQEVSPVG